MGIHADTVLLVVRGYQRALQQLDALIILEFAPTRIQLLHHLPEIFAAACRIRLHAPGRCRSLC